MESSRPVAGRASAVSADDAPTLVAHEGDQALTTAGGPRRPRSGLPSLRRQAKLVPEFATDDLDPRAPAARLAVSPEEYLEAFGDLTPQEIAELGRELLEEVEGDTPCERAYSALRARSRHPAFRGDTAPNRSAFMHGCRARPKEQQKCLDPTFAVQSDECRGDRGPDDVPGRPMVRDLGGEDVSGQSAAQAESESLFPPVFGQGDFAFDPGPAPFDEAAAEERE